MSRTVLYTLHLEFPPMQIFASIVSAVVFILLGWNLINDFRKREKSLLRSVLFFGIGVLLLWSSSVAPLLDHMALRDAWKAGEIRTVEGVVSNSLYEQRPNGICQEQFTIDGVNFFCEEWDYFPGYFRCGNIFSGKTSVINGDGQFLRVTYVPNWPYEDSSVNAIVQIEELSD